MTLTPRQAILKALTEACGKYVRANALIDAVWPKGGNAANPKHLAVQIHHLRKDLAHDSPEQVIESKAGPKSPGYRLVRRVQENDQT